MDKKDIKLKKDLNADSRGSNADLRGYPFWHLRPSALRFSCLNNKGFILHPSQKGAIFNFFAYFLVIFIIITIAIFLPRAKAQNAQLSITQEDWGGGAQEGSIATLTDWTQYDYADLGISVTPQGDLTMGMLSGEFKDAVADDFKQVMAEEKPRGTRALWWNVGMLVAIVVTVISAIYMVMKILSSAGHFFHIMSRQ